MGKTFPAYGAALHNLTVRAAPPDTEEHVAEVAGPRLRMLDELFATGSRDDWVERLRGADIVAAPINTLLEASNDPDVLANGYVTEIDYPKHGKRLKVHGSPWHFSETPAQIGVAPELGNLRDSHSFKLLILRLG